MGWKNQYIIKSKWVFSDVLWFHFEFWVLHIILNSPVTWPASKDNRPYLWLQHHNMSNVTVNLNSNPMLHWPIKVMTGVLSSIHKAHTHLNSVWLSNLPPVLTPYICICNTVILIFTWYSALLGEKKKCKGKLTGHFDIIKMNLFDLLVYLPCFFSWNCSFLPYPFRSCFFYLLHFNSLCESHYSCFY